MLLSNYLRANLWPRVFGKLDIVRPSISHPLVGGCWSWFVDSRGVYYNGKTYGGAIDASGSPVVFSMVDGNGVGAFSVLKVAMEYDDHDNPSFLIRDSDKKILAFYTKHDNTVIYLRISSNAEDIATFAAESDLAASIGATKYTYPNPIQLTSETNDPIYLFFRDTPGGNALWSYSVSTDGGATWSALTALYGYATSSYLHFFSNGTDRIDFASSMHPGNDNSNRIFHFYYTGGNFYQTDGTQIVTALPFDGTEVTTALTCGGTDEVWVWDIVKSGSNIAIAHTFYPSGSTANVTYYYTIWNGSVWASHEIVASGGSLPTVAGEEFYTGGIVIDKSDINTVYLSKKVNGVFEIWKYVTADSGANWSGTAITTNSTQHNCRPYVIQGAGTYTKVLWWRGLYPSYLTYATQIMGTGT